MHTYGIDILGYSFYLYASCRGVPKPLCYTEAMNKYINAQIGFALDSFKRVTSEQHNNEDKNILVSPLSIMTALSVAANGASGNTLKEIEEALGGLTIDEINDLIFNGLSGMDIDEINRLISEDASAALFRYGIYEDEDDDE